MKEIITTKFNGMRVVAAGKGLHFGEDWKVFPDFLSAYLGGLLNPKWGEPNLQLPIEEQHPINQWYSLMVRQQAGVERTKEGLVPCSNGAAVAWFRLAYDLYLIEHNGELQNRLVRRLRDPHHFQGARFEIAVAAMMLAAGYELEFCDEKGPGKHPEFLATHQATETQFAVEAKSRHRSGIMGFNTNYEPNFDGVLGISNLLQLAVNKEPSESLIVFVELNAPIKMTKQSCQSVYEELNGSWQAVQDQDWPNGFPCAGVMFYNDVAPWFLTEHLGSDGAPLWATGLWPNKARHEHDPRELIMRLVKACASRTSIPHEFPGS